MYWTLTPEVPGNWVELSDFVRTADGFDIHSLRFSFDGYLGSDLITSSPVFLVSDRLARAIEAAGLSGVEIREATVVKSEQYLALQSIARYPSQLPIFHWLYITGRAGQHDVGFSDRRPRLVVSDKALSLINQFSLKGAELAPYIKGDAT